MRITNIATENAQKVVLFDAFGNCPAMIEAIHGATGQPVPGTNVIGVLLSQIPSLFSIIDIFTSDPVNKQILTDFFDAESPDDLTTMVIEVPNMEGKADCRSYDLRYPGPFDILDDIWLSWEDIIRYRRQTLSVEGKWVKIKLLIEHDDQQIVESFSRVIKVEAEQ